jgi:5-methylcytosine-specific restriction endonuclease McrA
MSHRHFTKNQRRMLLWLSGGLCQLCDKRLTDEFHADHVRPYSKGGPTITINGQALCAKCNLKKGPKWN